MEEEGVVLIVQLFILYFYLLYLQFSLLLFVIKLQDGAFKDTVILFARCLGFVGEDWHEIVALSIFFFHDLIGHFYIVIELFQQMNDFL